MIKADGKIVNTLPIDQVSNGVAEGGILKLSIYHTLAALIKATIQKIQERKSKKKSMVKLLRELKSIFPKAKIQGHRDFPNVQKSLSKF